MRTHSPTGKYHHLEDTVHYRYDNALEPALTVDSGDTVTLVCREAADGQFTRDSDTSLLDGLDCDRIHARFSPACLIEAASFRCRIERRSRTRRAA
jgi:acetamidase/formamidase